MALASLWKFHFFKNKLLTLVRNMPTWQNYKMKNDWINSEWFTSGQIGSESGRNDARTCVTATINFALNKHVTSLIVKHTDPHRWMHGGVDRWTDKLINAPAGWKAWRNAPTTHSFVASSKWTISIPHPPAGARLTISPLFPSLITLLWSIITLQWHKEDEADTTHHFSFRLLAYLALET